MKIFAGKNIKITRGFLPLKWIAHLFETQIGEHMHYFIAECRLINALSGTNNNYTWLLTVENGLHTYLKYKKANIWTIEQYLSRVGECEPCDYCETS